MDRQKITSTILIILEAGLLCAVLIFSVFFNNSTGDKKPSGDKQNEQTAQNNQNTEQDDTSASNDGTENEGNSGQSQGGWFSSEEREVFSAEVEAKLATMTIEQKVAQLFITTPEELTGVDRVTISGNGTRDALANYPVAGLIYSNKNFVGYEQCEALIGGAQGHCNTAIGLPLFILISEDASLYKDYATLSLTPQEKGSLAMEISAAPAITAGIQTCTYTNSIEVVAAVKGGMNMIYAPSNFIEIYGAVLEAVNNGTITQVRLENAVGKVLTEKLQ